MLFKRFVSGNFINSTWKKKDLLQKTPADVCFSSNSSRPMAAVWRTERLPSQPLKCSAVLMASLHVNMCALLFAQSHFCLSRTRNKFNTSSCWVSQHTKNLMYGPTETVGQRYPNLLQRGSDLVKCESVCEGWTLSDVIRTLTWNYWSILFYYSGIL